MNTDHTIKDSVSGGWVERMPASIRPFLRLSRYDRPIGFWLLALPGWIGLVFAALSHGFASSDLKWAILIGIGAIAMRGAGCTYNDIVDRDLDKMVERTALRPLAAGTISVTSAWIWLVLQCLVGLAVLAFFPRLSQIIALTSLALVAAYPFMKRITFWPQAWLGLTFNWAVLVAYSAKTGHVTPSLFLLYFGLVFWTIGYDTIYACQDIEDDAMIGVKSTARLFGGKVKLGVGISYLLCVILLFSARYLTPIVFFADPEINANKMSTPLLLSAIGTVAPFAIHLARQVFRLSTSNNDKSLQLFKSNRTAALLLILMWILSAYYWNYTTFI